MATIDYDPLNEEENFTNGSLNTRFDELAGTAKGVNAIPVSAIASNSLRHHQVPSLIPTQDITSSPKASDHGQSRSWTVEFHPSGRKVYTGGSSSSKHVVTGGAAQELRIDFPSGIKLGMGSGTDGVKGLLVLANVHVMTMEDIESVLSLSKVDNENTIVFALEVAKDSALTDWETLDRTRRVLSQSLISFVELFGGGRLLKEDDSFTESPTDYAHSMRFDVPLRTLISAGDISTIYGVRVVCWPSGVSGSWNDGAIPPNEQWTTRAANLSVIPFHAGGTLV